MHHSVGQETLTKIFLCDVRHMMNRWTSNMKKIVSTFILLLVSLRKINVAKAEPKNIVVPTRAHKSSE